MIENDLPNRCWCEINLSNLEENTKKIKSIIPSNTKIMAVVKANAYGHDLVIISKKLNEIGITDFAVATLEEGITLRKNNIKGNILILGYTSISNIKYVLKYDLIQTVVSLEYATKLMNLSLDNPLKVHIKINTGMNRIGISFKEYNKIKEIYTKNKLNILGIYTHLCVCNSKKKSDILFTKLQIMRFDSVINFLKTNKINPGKTHVQSSYGVLNYPECHYDYVRVGMLLYGVYNDKKTYQKIKLDLKPVLSLKAKVTSVNKIKKGEGVGYGRNYIATKDEIVAAVSIGYVDGYPKSISNMGLKVMVNNSSALVIGNICMDQLVIRINNNTKVKEGDVVTLIGEDKCIKAEEIATKINTITPELLGRLNTRLEYIPKN